MNIIAIQIRQPDGKLYPIEACIEKVTKATARKMLDMRAPCQRKIISWSRSKMTEDMNGSKWWFTGSPIIIDSNGKLIDGQHRLEAFLDSNLESQDFLIVTGVPKDAYIAIDRGVGKSTGDYFKFEGIPNASVAAATARWLLRYDRQEGGLFLHTSLVTDSAVEEWYYKYAEDIQQAIGTYPALSTFIGSASLTVALDIIITKAYGSEFSQRFFSEFSTGVTQGAILKLHKAIDLDNKRPRRHITPDQRFSTILAAAKSSHDQCGRKLFKPAIQRIIPL